MWDSRFCAQNSPKLNAGFPALGDAEDIIFGGKFNGLFHAFSLNFTPQNHQTSHVIGLWAFFVRPVFSLFDVKNHAALQVFTQVLLQSGPRSAGAPEICHVEEKAIG